MKGGKIKGYGAFGCVFQPSLTCKYPNDTIKNKDYVSKLQTNEEGVKEMRIGKYIKNNLNNYEDYTIIPESKCKPSSTQQDKDIKKCVFFNLKRNSNYYALIMSKYGGTTFESKIKSLISATQKKNDKRLFIKNYSNFIKEMSSLFLGISEFYENDLIHNDIKEQNILKLAKNTDSLEKGLRFIDFGLSGILPHDIESLKEKSQVSFLEPRWYFVYPPEYLYCMGSAFRSHPLRKEYDGDLFKKRALYNNIRDTHVKIVKTCKTNKEFDDRIKMVILKSLELDYNNNELLYDIFTKIDVYSLAMSCVFLFSYIKNSGTKSIIQIISQSKKGTFLGDFRLLLKKMLDLNYKKRIDATSAYKEFMKLLKKDYSKSKSSIKTKKKQKKITKKR